MVSSPPPSKQDQLHKLLERGSVFVHLDPRRDGVLVPSWLAKKPQLVLQVGLNFPIPIRDLEIDEASVRCTLSFNRAPFYCVLPWTAVYALVAEDGQVTVWPSELPSELVPQAEPAVRREGPRDRRAKVSRPRISVVPPPPTSLGAAASATDGHAAAAPETTASSVEPMTAVADDGGTNDAATTPPPSPSDRPARERPPWLRLVK